LEPFAAPFDSRPNWEHPVRPTKEVSGRSSLRLSHPGFDPQAFRVFLGQELGRLIKGMLIVLGRDHTEILQPAASFVSINCPTFHSIRRANKRILLAGRTRS